jgi:putative endonuclease
LWLCLIRKRLLSDRAELGRWGEKYCERYLKRKGFKFIARNFVCKTGELDLVMWDNGVVVFVEVKTRSNEQFASAESAINYTKQKRLIRAAKFFAAKYSLQDKPMRFDAAAIILGKAGKPQIRYHQNIIRVR